MTEKPERLAWLSLVPVFATLSFYGLPSTVRHYGLAPFLPQFLAYLAIALWSRHNTQFFQRLGLSAVRLWSGIGWGILVGLLLGTCNTIVILWGVPALGGDISFLKQTPHAQVPTLIMVPWGILLIAVVVEINFRGFLLGRLAALFTGLLDGQTIRPHSPERHGRSGSSAAAIGTSSLLFAFDPFMVITFQHLHWIALWDGLIWGMLWIQRRNLYIPIVAHAVEVVILYSVVRAWLER